MIILFYPSLTPKPNSKWGFLSNASPSQTLCRAIDIDSVHIICSAIVGSFSSETWGRKKISNFTVTI